MKFLFSFQRMRYLFHLPLFHFPHFSSSFFSFHTLRILPCLLPRGSFFSFPFFFISFCISLFLFFPFYSLLFLLLSLPFHLWSFLSSSLFFPPFLLFLLIFLSICFSFLSLFFLFFPPLGASFTFHSSFFLVLPRINFYFPSFVLFDFKISLFFSSSPFLLATSPSLPFFSPPIFILVCISSDALKYNGMVVEISVEFN